MALLPPQFLNSVAAIGRPGSDSSEIAWIGTGFIYGVEAIGSGGRLLPFLVTNAHVVAGMETIIIKANRVDALPAEEYEVNISEDSELLTFHPERLDVVVLPIPGEFLDKGFMATTPITESQSLSAAKAGEIGISEGDGIFAIGFPMELVGYEDQIFPIVKQGCIARIQDWLSGRSRHILIDANIFPGNSGGPIFLRPSSTSVAGTKANPASYLIGMVSAYIPYRDVAVSLQTLRERIIFEENSGIVEIVPSDVIMETVNMAAQKLQVSAC